MEKIELDLKSILIKLKDMLPEHRLRHSEGVAESAVKLSEIYGYNKAIYRFSRSIL